MIIGNQCAWPTVHAVWKRPHGVWIMQEPGQQQLAVVPRWVEGCEARRQARFVGWIMLLVGTPHAPLLADVVIDDPENSAIMCVYGAELVPTTQFASKYTLRFPRVDEVRVDKVRRTSSYACALMGPHHLHACASPGSRWIRSTSCIVCWKAVLMRALSWTLRGWCMVVSPRSDVAKQRRGLLPRPSRPGVRCLSCAVAHAVHCDDAAAPSAGCLPSDRLVGGETL